MVSRAFTVAVLLGATTAALASGGPPKKAKAAMDETRFWHLIEDASRATPGHDIDAADLQAAALEAKLATLPVEDIVAFQSILEAKRNLAFRWDLWGAAYLLNGGCSDDCFDYFRGWLLGRGRKVFEDAVRNPDTLAEFAASPSASEPYEGARECERFLSVARVAYRKVAGREIPDTHVPLVREPAGKPWNEDDLPKLLPRIAERVARAAVKSKGRGHDKRPR